MARPATSQHGPCDSGDALVRDSLPEFVGPKLKAWMLARLDAGEKKYGAPLRVGWEKADEALTEELADAINYAVASGRVHMAEVLCKMLGDIEVSDE